jgi:GntR family transcriptional repressor for pyruvate dehydrogenase complex
LKENIVTNNWKPGDKIPSENHLVSLFGVSRMSIRVAIQKMITLGLLEARAGEGTFVKEFTPNIYINELVPFALRPKNQLEILEFRKALETEAIKLAIKRATEDEIRELENIFRRMLKAIQENNWDKYFKEDYQFHFQIIKMSKNSIFVDVVETLADILFIHYDSFRKDILDRDGIPPTFGKPNDPHNIMMIGIKNRDEKMCLDAFLDMIQLIVKMYENIKDNDN